MLEGLKELGKTILLTTHYLEEAQHLADQIAVIDHGKVIAEGTPATLGGRDGGAVIRFTLPAGSSLADLPVGGARLSGSLVELETASPTRALHQLTDWAVQRGWELEHLEVRPPSLEDVYLELTGDD
jgi:ABC-2 type transport system ATP-binding protein